MGSRRRGGQRRRPSARPANPARPRPGGRATRSAPSPQALRAEARRAEERRRWKFLGLALAGCLAVLGIGIFLNVDEQDQAGDVLAALTGGDCSLDDEADVGADHVADPEYSVNPPAGGDHTPTPARPGGYDSGDIPPDGDLVQALENGFVILWHQPDLAAADRQALTRLHEANEGSTLVVSRRSLAVPVAATAWHRRLLCAGGVEDKPLSTFISTYQGKGPKKGEPPDFPG